MPTLRDIRAHADRCLLANEPLSALHAYCAIVQLQPVDLDARLRIADSLLALGEVQRAAVVYTALARHATHAGYPLRALVALKVLTALEPQLASLLAPLAELYSVESKRLGRGVRIAPGDPDQEAPATLDLSRAIPLEQLAPHAEKVGSDTSNIPYPDKLPPIPLFSELRAEAFGAILQALKLRRVRPGEVVIAEGEPGHSFFVIARGEVKVAKQLAQGGETVLAALHEGAIFGEMALVSAAPRSATVTAVADTDLLEFDRDALQAAARDVATLAAALDKFTRERLLSNLLQTSPLFRPLDRKQRLDLVRRFTAHDVAAGVQIIGEGQPARGLFVLLAGEVDVSKRDGATKVLLASLKPGDVFGEISLLNDEPATATVTAARQSTVLFLARDIFQRLCAAFPEIREYVSTLGEERAMDTRLLMEAGADVEELADDDLVLV
jgi:CRP-like cAMP-binding protein